MIFAVAVFVISFVGIAALFAQKAVETRRGTVVLPALKSRLDSYADTGKVLLERARIELEHLPPTLIRLSRIALHQAALAAAAAARYVERELHRLAEMVSHKRTFEHREQKNEFLKQVSEHKNENGIDTTEDHSE